MINFIKKEKRNRACPAKRGRSRGFTLVETLVALFIFSVSILTVMSALSRGISSTIYAKDKIVAEYLSQEGIEYFRNIRDTSMLYTSDKTQSWIDFTTKLHTNCETTRGCYFDNNETIFPVPLTTNILISCGGNQCRKFLYETSSGKYNYTTGSQTTFSRTIWTKQAVDGKSVKIISEVTFSAGSGTGTVSLSENLSNWIE